MDSSQRLQLNQIIDDNNVEDYTALIREKCHSGKIRAAVTKMIDIIKANEGTDAHTLDNLLMAECAFMFNHYTDIYNRIKKQELDLSILWEFLNVLEKIETGEADQHTAAFEVGSLLKKMYIDSAMRSHSKDDANPGTSFRQGKQISWREYNKSAHRH